MEAKEKQHIVQQLDNFIGKAGSQNKAATQLRIASATLSAIMAGKWDSISDEMWAKVAAGIGINRLQDWTIAPNTQAYQTISFILQDAQDNAAAYWITGEAGSGKTTTARAYAAQHRNAYYIQCSIDMRRSHFVQAVATALGIRSTAHYPYEIWEDVTAAICRMDEAPLIIFDEADKLSDSVFQYFIDLYNKTYGLCGIVWMSTDAIKTRFDRGLKWARQGYKELYSRIGNRFNDLPAASPQDVLAVCQANGIHDRRVIEQIAQQTLSSGFDMRHVRKMIHRHFKVETARAAASPEQ